MKTNYGMLYEGEPGAGNQNATPPAGGGTPPTAGTNSFDWGKIKESLPEDIRGDSSLSTITSLEGLAKSYIHAQKQFGKEKFTVPDKHATPDDWFALSQKLGNPSKLDEYKLNLGEMQIEESVLGKLKEVAHKKGVLPWQLESILTGYNEVVQPMIKQQELAAETAHTERVNALKSAWGTNYETKVKEAQAAMTHLLPDANDQKALIEAGFGDHPAILKMLANARKLMSDDQLIGQGDGKLSNMSKEEALTKARGIQGDPNHPYRNVAHPNHLAAKKEVQDLYKLAFPE